MHAASCHTEARHAPRRNAAGRAMVMAAQAYADVLPFACPDADTGSTIPAPPAGAGRACDTSGHTSRGLAPGLSCLLAAGLGVIAAALPGDPARIACAALVCAWLLFTMHVAAASLRTLLCLPTDDGPSTGDNPCDHEASQCARRRATFRDGGHAAATGGEFPPEVPGADSALGFAVPSVHCSAGGSTLPLHLQPDGITHGSSPWRRN
ncbi:hypothetical protein [Nitratidesulfovibrio liaohensis]|uniref:Uncharacterized protein n=1 Tax=Nitratidesulfovibrio liaohensis TaxID=2604158 RepID=A0ABY9QXJ0_9BACT|nr:hypothetical protein [Nitratidesulfovibrio liaohensis]WMW64022.1 hypothetical protein KPS_001998 [Nitratidesulfovibrio liaohensis]